MLRHATKVWFNSGQKSVMRSQGTRVHGSSMMIKPVAAPVPGFRAASLSALGADLNSETKSLVRYVPCNNALASVHPSVPAPPTLFAGSVMLQRLNEEKKKVATENSPRGKPVRGFATFIRNKQRVLSHQAHKLAKRLREQKPTVHYLLTAAKTLAHPSKVKNNEDAFFVSPRVLGVADGVGGWAAQGVDSSLFSRGLMSACLSVANSGVVDTGIIHSSAADSPPFWTTSVGSDDNQPDQAEGHHTARAWTPRSFLWSALKEVQKRNLPGTATACVFSVFVDPSDCSTPSSLKFWAINLGDSGFIVARPRADGTQGVEARLEIVHRSQPQQSGFNTPFQMGASMGHTPDDADVYTGQLCVGDIIIVATDGFFDNVHDEQMLTILQGSHNSKNKQSLVDTSQRVDRTAQLLLDSARANGLSMVTSTPWSEALNRRHPNERVGGKPDDITILVAVVKQGNDSI